MAWLKYVLVLGLVCLYGQVNAGMICNKPATTESRIVKILDEASQAYTLIDKLVPNNVAIIARRGQNLDEYGLKYSHMGFIYKNDANEWKVIHKLNTCGTNQATIVKQGLADFVADDLYSYDLGIIEFDENTSIKILKALNDRDTLFKLNDPNYSMMAYTWGLEFQQSNQWLTETLAYVLDPTIENRMQAQNWLRLNKYEPAPVQVGPIKRTAVNLINVPISFKDHPVENLKENKIVTTTADSFIGFLKEKKIASLFCEVYRQKQENILVSRCD